MTESNFSTFKARAFRPGQVALLTFHATWCAPSQTQMTAIDSLAKALSGKVVFGLVDVDLDPGSADEFEARTLPTSVLMVGGEMVETLTGYQAEEFLRAYLDQLLGASAAEPGSPTST